MESDQRHDHTISEMNQSQERALADIRSLITGLNRQQTGVRSQAQAQLNSGNLSQHQFQSKLTRIEFPRFDGEDLDGWIFKCNQFF